MYLKTIWAQVPYNEKEVSILISIEKSFTHSCEQTFWYLFQLILFIDQNLLVFIDGNPYQKVNPF
jgi:hypothetical protein